ncbi:hypothetical protein EC846_1567 [Acinetobacter sp. BIGb0102]|uniref:hypothetical protein n=1 Tax=Acinetobacter sp. BIGb0102 TaxID=2485131 RepID=UPI000F4D767E|nr:hypothetical protein [Acinetobacter sp. BIGb0102]RPE30866.1 hypothetical protein EC846_1567 [Acinetobacter sp. BIGb0102]
MFDWFEGRLGRVAYAFSEFPVLKWRSIFFVFLIVMAAILYQPFVVLLYKFNIMGMYVFQEIIQQNVKLIIWGQGIVPIVIAVWGYFDVVSLYEEKHLKKYKCLPKWVN